MASPRIIKPKRIRINQRELIEEYLEDVSCFAIQSKLNSYPFVITMNEYFFMDFRLSPSSGIRTKGVSPKRTPKHLLDNNLNIFSAEREEVVDDEDREWEVYEDRDDVKNIEHFIICNHKESEYLLDTLRHVDFIWMMKGGFVTSKYLERTIENLKKVPGFGHVYRFDPMTVKGRENLVL